MDEIVKGDRVIEATEVCKTRHRVDVVTLAKPLPTAMKKQSLLCRA